MKASRKVLNEERSMLRESRVGDTGGRGYERVGGGMR